MTKRDTWIPDGPLQYAAFLRTLRSSREGTKRAHPRDTPRLSLRPEERDLIQAKTNGRCHVCGGTIESGWHADHVLAVSGGGHDAAENFLPAHPLCNNYRWDYSPAEFQEILRLGVWLRTQVERETGVGKAAASAFIKHEKSRIVRRA